MTGVRVNILGEFGNREYHKVPEVIMVQIFHCTLTRGCDTKFYDGGDH